MGSKAKIAIVSVIVTAGIISWMLGSSLSFNAEIDESLNDALNEIHDGMTYKSFVEMTETKRIPIVEKMSDKLKQDVMDRAALSQTVVSKQVDDVIMSKINQLELELIKEGVFVGLGKHQASGIVQILKVNEEISILRFENFEVTNGPDLRVYLTPYGDVDEGIQLDKLHGSLGNQNYVLEKIDITAYDTVVIYCQPFGVYFGKADLSQIKDS